MQDENGYYDYYYAGNNYEFVFEQEVYIARQHDNTSTEARFLSHKVKVDNNWIESRFEKIPYENSGFQKAINHLQNVEGVCDVKLLIFGSQEPYMPVNLE